MKYLDLYHEIKQDILNHKYQYKQKLPSIREMTVIKNVSRTTVERAYQQLLLEGFIESRDKVGYFLDVKEFKEYKALKQDYRIKKEKSYLYDFSGNSVDEDIFQLDIWKKYIKIAFEDESLFKYGDEQGEYRLRELLVSYGHFNRGIQADSNNCIIGSGFQPLLSILLGLFDVKSVGLPQSGFIQAERIFADFKLNIEYIEEDNEGITLNALKKADIQLLYLHPSKSTNSGKPLSISRKNAIIEYCKRNHIYIIEDDHNGELRYINRPIDAMQKIDPSNIIYIGSFSKLLIPSIRIAYMLLPDSLLSIYLARKKQYHQTVSRFEQIAFMHYIENGQLTRQLKRSRKVYSKKCKYMIQYIKDELKNIDFIVEETSLRIKLFVKYDKQKIENESILVKYEKDGILLSFSGIEDETIQKGIQKLKKCILS